MPSHLRLKEVKEEQQKTRQHFAYAVSNTLSASDYSSFANTDFNFAAVGDWGCNSNTHDTVNNILSKKPQLVLGLGDYSYSSTADCWIQMVEPIVKIMKIAIGNHDNMRDEALHQFLNYFNLTNPYYSFNYRNVHFTAISTDHPYAVGSEQYNFVNNDLLKAASDPNIDWIIVYYHRPMYTSPTTHPGDLTLTSIYHPIFDKYGVDIVIQGHNHDYQRSYPLDYNISSPSQPILTKTLTDTNTNNNNFNNNYTDPKGRIFITVGTGGAPTYNFKGKASYIVSQYAGYGILDIDITNGGTKLVATFYANEDGSVKDTFTITKLHKPKLIAIKDELHREKSQIFNAKTLCKCQ